MRRLLIGSFTLAAALSAAAVSQAHIKLMDPPARHPDSLKTGPCGVANDARGSAVTALQAGQTLTIAWDETIEHPGHYRIMFNENGFDFPVPANGADFCDPAAGPVNGVHCLVDNIADQPNGPNYTQAVTIPNVNCTNCTLQLIQWMSDKENDGIANNEIYYSCADVTVSDGSSGQGGGTSSSSSSGAGGSGQGGDPTTSSSSSSSASSGGSTDPGATDSGIQPTDSTSGCHLSGLSGSAASSAAAAALALLALGARRRRSGR